MFPLSRILFTQLAAQHDDAETIDWNAVLHHAPITPSGTHYRDHLQYALDLGVLTNVMEFLPHTRPAYLPPGEEGIVRVRAPRATSGQHNEPGNESGQGLRPPR